MTLFVILAFGRRLSDYQLGSNEWRPELDPELGKSTLNRRKRRTLRRTKFISFGLRAVGRRQRANCELLCQQLRLIVIQKWEMTDAKFESFSALQ